MGVQESWAGRRGGAVSEVTPHARVQPEVLTWQCPPPAGPGRRAPDFHFRQLDFRAGQSDFPVHRSDFRRGPSGSRPRRSGCHGHQSGSRGGPSGFRGHPSGFRAHRSGFRVPPSGRGRGQSVHHVPRSGFRSRRPRYVPAAPRFHRAPPGCRAHPSRFRALRWCPGRPPPCFAPASSRFRPRPQHFLGDASHPGGARPPRARPPPDSARAPSCFCPSQRGSGARLHDSALKRSRMCGRARGRPEPPGAAATTPNTLSRQHLRDRHERRTRLSCILV